MKTRRKMRRGVGVAILLSMLLVGLCSAADTVDHFLELTSELDPAAADGLIEAMYRLDDDLSDVDGDVEDLRLFFMENPREYLRTQGVDLPETEYYVTALNFGELKGLPNAFDESPLSEGITALPYTIGWQSYNMIMLLQLAVPEPVIDEATGEPFAYATVFGDPPATQEYLRAVVGTPDALLLGMIQLLVQLTRDDELRGLAVETGLRQFAANQDWLFESGVYALQIIDLDPIAGPKPELGIHFGISEGEGPKVPELVGFVFIPVEGAGYGVTISRTF